MHAPCVHKEVLRLIGFLRCRVEVRKGRVIERVSLLVAVRERGLLQHQHAIWQVIQHLRERVPSLLCPTLHHEKLREDSSDKVGRHDHEHPVHWDHQTVGDAVILGLDDVHFQGEK